MFDCEKWYKHQPEQITEAKEATILLSKQIEK